MLKPETLIKCFRVEVILANSQLKPRETSNPGLLDGRRNQLSAQTLVARFGQKAHAKRTDMRP